MNSRLIFSIVILIIVILSISMFYIVSDSTDIKDFTYTTTIDTKKYDTIIKKGIAKWAEIGVNGKHIYFRSIFNNKDKETIAKASGNTIYIFQNVFDNLSTDKERIITITHEVGHVLGIGLWSSSDVLTENGIGYLNPLKYPETSKAYIDHYRPNDINLPGPPIEVSGGSGTSGVHWENDPKYGLYKSIMCGTIYVNSDLITIVDLAYLKETGVKVENIDKGKKHTLFYKIRDHIVRDKKIND